MPLSRSRKKQKRRSPFYHTSLRAPSGGLKIESMFDRAKQARRRLGHGRVLYHYTNWEAAESIIASQRFRATAHRSSRFAFGLFITIQNAAMSTVSRG